MNRISAAVLIAAIALAAVVFEASAQGAFLRKIAAEWLAANALPEHPEKIAAIELPPDHVGMSALDAALVLRAVLRYEPKAVAFLVPIEMGGDVSLLSSKLEDAKIPVVFTSNEALEPLSGIGGGNGLPQLLPTPAFVPSGYGKGCLSSAPGGQVLIVARQGAGMVASSVWKFCAPAGKVTGAVPGILQAGVLLAPVNAAGCADLNPLAGNYVEHIAFPQLVLQTERSEQGSISAVLDGKFRGRMVAVQKTGEDQAAGISALRNRLADFSPPITLTLAAVLLAASLPWWGSVRRTRVLLALMAGCAWMLMALAIYSEFRMVSPLLLALLLPVLALIPRGANPPSNEVHQRELPA